MSRIVVIGSINMDLAAGCVRIPNPGETLIADRLDYNPGGKGANQAVAAARLGAEVTMIGCVGDDAFGGELLDNLRRNGVRTDCVKRLESVPSGMAMIAVSRDDNAILVIPGANAKVTPQHLDDCIQRIEEADAILFQNEIPMETIDYGIGLCHRLGKKVIYNPAPASELPEGVMDRIFLLTPNQHEAALLFPECSGLEQVFERFPEKLVVTLGSRGAAYMSRSGRPEFVPARPAKLVDTTGAGDTFNGALAVALAEGMDMAEAIGFANSAASISTETSGAQNGMPYRAAVS